MHIGGYFVTDNAKGVADTRGGTVLRDRFHAHPALIRTMTALQAARNVPPSLRIAM
jgi:hypothetical protein